MSYTGSLSEIMNFATRKREVASNNITNQNTNGYKAKVVTWNENFGKIQSDLRTTNENHISIGGNDTTYKIEQDETTQITSNGNNVDLNNEMIELMKSNQISSVAIQAYNKHSEAMSAARGN